VSLDSAISIANSSLANINRQLALVSHNVANANTPGYAREVATQSAMVAGGQGMGVRQGLVQREIDLQLQGALLSQNALVSGLQTRSAGLQSIDAVQGTPGANSDLSSKLGAMQDSFITLQADPSNASAQSQVIAAASTLASHINTISNAYSTARQNAQDGVQAGVTQLNATLQTLSELNAKIIAGQQVGQGTADLENQRSAAMTTMSQLIDVSFIAQRNGGVIAATKGGLVLSLTNPAPQFQMTPSIANAQTYYPGGGIQPITLLGQDVTKSLTGGQIGANLTLRDTTLPTNQGELDEFANTLQSRFSAQGLQLFTPPAGGTAPPPAQARYIGYAATIAVNPLVSANPRLVRDGTTAVAASPSGPSAFTPNPAGGPASFGTLINRVLTYTMGANVQAGVPQPPPATTGLGPLGSLQAQFAPPTDLASFATSLVTAQSTDVASAQSSLQTETTLQTTLQARATATSGVDTDAELSLMVILQKDYGATAKIIAAAQTMWNQLLTMIP